MAGAVGGLFPRKPPEVLLLTNAHVVNPDGTDEALAPDQAQANFQGLGSILEFRLDSRLVVATR